MIHVKTRQPPYFNFVNELVQTYRTAGVLPLRLFFFSFSRHSLNKLGFDSAFLNEALRGPGVGVWRGPCA